MRVHAPLPENLVSLRFVCFLLCTTVTRQMFLFVPSVLASLTCFKTKVLIWAAEKRVTRGTSYNLFAPFMKSSPSNIEDSPEYALEIFQDFNFLWQDKLFSNMDITIFPNTAIPIGEGLLALKYFHWHQSALKKRLLRLNDLEWTLNFFHSGTRVGWPHFYSQQILDGAQNMNVRSSIPNWNSNFLFVLRSWWDEFHIFLLFTCSSRWKNVSFISEPWVTSKTRAYGNITLT